MLREKRRRARAAFSSPLLFALSQSESRRRISHYCPYYDAAPKSERRDEGFLPLQWTL
jgi:hypothetical protein